MRKTYQTQYDIATDNRASWPTPEEMAELLWKMPTTRIAALIGVSDVAVGKFCKKHGLKKPARGHWAKNGFNAEHSPRKITLKLAEEIRAKYALGTVTQLALAKEYGITQSHVSRIVNKNIS